MPARDMENYDYMIGSIGAIGRVAVDFCGAQLDLCESAIKECSNMFRTKWPGMSVAEIKEAFSLYVSDSLDTDKTTVVAFYGMFTVDIFSRVMLAYEKKRNHAIVELARLAEEEEKKKQEDRKRAEYQEYKQRVCEDFQALCISNEKFDSYEKIPFIWAKILIEAGLLDGRNSTLWIAAKDVVINEFLTDYREKRPHAIISEGQKRNVYDRLIKEPYYFPEELSQTAKNTYGRLLVFNNISKFKQPE